MLTPLSKRRSDVYTDFHKDLTQSPVNLDLARKTDEEAVKESIRNLIMTDRGERLFQPQLGSDVRKMLFENITPANIQFAKDLIKTTIKNYEPRANLISVDVYDIDDTLNLNIVITFNIINKIEPIVLTVTLDRVR